MNLIRVMPAKGLDNMNASSFLARLLGPLLLVVGVSIAVNRKAFGAIATEFLASRALLCFAGYAHSF